jgi:hypothetical protein
VGSRSTEERLKADCQIAFRYGDLNGQDGSRASLQTDDGTYSFGVTP